MNGSARQSNAGIDSPRAPYAAPQSPVAVLSVPASGTGSAEALRPFIPPGFRDAPRDAWFHGSAVGAAGGGVSWEPTPAHDDSASSSNELPWIETFADAAPVAASGSYDAVPRAAEPGMEGGAEDSWMLGEAGRRLDELTRSLSSLDALRKPDDEPGTVGAEQKAHGAWGDDEWMDIMPAASHEPEALAGHVSDAEASAAHGSQFAESAATGEAAARALEAVAARVRSGDLALPAFGGEPSAPQPGEAALLAAVLAALLGFRRG